MDYINYSPKMMPFQGLTGFGGGATSFAVNSSAAGFEVKTGWYGNRAVFINGYGNSNHVEYVSLTSTGNSSDFGETINSSRARAPASNGSRGLAMGGRSQSSGNDEEVEYITIGTTGNGQDFGDLSTNAGSGYASGTSGGGVNNNVRGICGGGNGTAGTTDIEYFTIASTGNGTDLADLAISRYGLGAATSGTHCVFGGAQGGGTGAHEQIDIKAIDTSANCTDFGDLTGNYGEGYCSATSNGSGRAVYGACGGNVKMNYIQIQTSANATDFGDMNNDLVTYATGWTSGDTNGERGICAGSDSNPDAMSYITISTPGDASNFGDLQFNFSFRCAVSGN